MSKDATHNIIQIVPRLPPAVDGVGDYALILAHELRERNAIETEFICGNPVWKGPPTVEGFRARYVATGSGRELEKALDKSAAEPLALLLHYVGYGYQPGGCPFWLLRGLRTWKRAHGHTRLLVMFHEYYSDGPPWSRAFWTNPLQKYIGSRLAHISDEIRTNVHIVEKRLKAASPNLPVKCVPVYSNLGEVDYLPGYHNRKPWLAVFGSREWRRQAFFDQGESLRKTCSILKIEKVFDIGAPLGLNLDFPVPVVSTGICSAVEISSILQQSRAGFFTYPSLWLGKSTIFSAYAAHGVIPVTYATNRSPDGEIQADREYLTIETLQTSQPDLEKFSESIFNWYQGHKISIQAQEYYEAIKVR